MLWSPTIRAALLAGTPWLDVFCPGCGTSKAIDLRTVDRHPLASVGTLVLGLRCSWCPGLGADAEADRAVHAATNLACGDRIGSVGCQRGRDGLVSVKGTRRREPHRSEGFERGLNSSLGWS